MNKVYWRDNIAISKCDTCISAEMCTGFFEGKNACDNYLEEDHIEETEGKKYDEGKADWHCVPAVLVEQLIPVFVAGIKKGYGRFNCLEHFSEPDNRFYSAAMRHLTASQLDPLAKDEETGCYHMAQVAFNALMRLYHCQKAAK